MGGRLKDYPEHLNPFREEGDGDDPKRNKFTALGRRKLRAVLSLTSRALFSWRKSKGSNEGNSSRNRFLMMTPKLSRHVLERLSRRKPRSTSLAPVSNPATSTSHEFSNVEFRILPRSSRKKFALNSTREKREEALEGSYLWADCSSAPDLTLSSTSTSPVSEVGGDNDLVLRTEPRNTKQGGKARKKRAAPPPPPGTPADHKHNSTAAETEKKAVSSTLSSPSSKDVDVSLQESPPPTPSSATAQTSTTTTCALIHEPSTPAKETSVPADTISVTEHDTSIPTDLSQMSDLSEPHPSSQCESLQQPSGTARVSEDTETVSEDTKTVTEHTKAVSEDTKSLSEDTNTVTEETKAVSEDTKSLSEDTKTVTEETKTVSDDTKIASEKTKSVSEVSEKSSEFSANSTLLDGEVNTTVCKL